MGGGAGSAELPPVAHDASPSGASSSDADMATVIATKNTKRNDLMNRLPSVLSRSTRRMFPCEIELGQRTRATRVATHRTPTDSRARCPLLRRAVPVSGLPVWFRRLGLGLDECVPQYLIDVVDENELDLLE